MTKDTSKPISHTVPNISSMIYVKANEGDLCFVLHRKTVFIRTRHKWVQVTEFEPEVQKEMNEVFSRESMKDICD